LVNAAPENLATLLGERQGTSDLIAEGGERHSTYPQITADFLNVFEINDVYAYSYDNAIRNRFGRKTTQRLQFETSRRLYSAWRQNAKS
jgi:hypothetical protein